MTTTTSTRTLGRGKVFFDAFLPGTQTLTGRRYIGNTPAFDLNVTATQLDHFSSDQGLKFKDDAVILQVDRKGTFTTDEVTTDNMALFLIGSNGVPVQAVLAGQTQTIANVLLDRYYQIGATAANPSGVRDVTVTTVATTAATPVPLVLNTDYTVDPLTGLLYIVPTSPVIIAALVAGAGITITYSATATTRNQVQTTVNPNVYGALYFQAFNPKGPNQDYFMPYTLVTPNGAFTLKGDTWLTVPFAFEALQLNSSTANIYVDGRALS
jgi:hypothetical protein